MTIQFNSDKTIKGDKRNQDFFTSQIEGHLDRYEPYITRIEVHLSDQNGNKEGRNDIQCLMEARLKGRKPIAVSDRADTIEQAVSGSIDKLKISLETILGRVQDH